MRIMSFLMGIVLVCLTVLAEEATLDIPADQWVGKRFIFLKKSTIRQKYGYDGLYLNKDHNKYRPQYKYNAALETETTYHLRYDKFVGKIIKVVDFEAHSFVVTFVVEETGMKVYSGTLYKEHVEGIAFFDDLAKAKERWLGRTIYSKIKTILAYNKELDKFRDIKINIGEPLKVIDVWWGDDSMWPLWIIVETRRGEKGFIATAYSWTNIPSHRWNEKRPWEDKFSEFSPTQSKKLAIAGIIVGIISVISIIKFWPRLQQQMMR